MRKQYYIYISTNKNNTVLYTGVTNNLKRRIYLHKKGLGSKFTKKYNINKLVYFEAFNSVYEAIAREKQLKAGSREKKLNLIRKNNPSFEDLFDSITN